MNIDQITLQNKKYSIDEAFAYCEKVTNTHYENFPVASMFLPQEKRPYIQAIYAFSRIADDFADELERDPEDRLADLEQWEEQLEDCFRGNAIHPVFIALGETVRRLNIPKEPFKDLLNAFKQDVLKNRYETFDEILNYCKYSANPVGRLVLMVFTYRDDALFRLSDKICTGLQLANFWQDISIDRKKDRLYLPLDEMKHYQYSQEDWQKEVSDDRFKQLIKFQVERTKNLFYDGCELPFLVDRDLHVELKMIWFGGMAILRKIERSGYDVIKHRPSLSIANMFFVLFRGLFYRDLSHYRRKKKPWDLT